MQCDMCGKEGNLYKSIIEGVELDVCEDCSKLGRKISKSYNKKEKIISFAPKIKIRKNLPEEDIVKGIVENYGSIIQKKREKLGLKQEELAEKIAEKISVIHNIESEHLEPNIKIAEKLEKFLKIKIIEEINELKYEKTRNLMERELTLGDMINIKKK